MYIKNMPISKNPILYAVTINLTRALHNGNEPLAFDKESQIQLKEFSNEQYRKVF
jgi:hypothetical protein